MYKRTIADVYKRNLSNYRRLTRLLFPSPAELRFIELFGGKMWTLKYLKSIKTGFPLTFIYKKPKLFKAEKVKREVRAGSKYIDFANDIGRGIEIQGYEYHRDVVKEFERELFLYQRGWKILYIEASSLYGDSADVQRRVLRFLLD